MKRQLIIVGSGKLAESIIKQCKKEKVPHTTWNNKAQKTSVVLYCGSAKLINEVVEFCLHTDSLLLMFSTDVKIPAAKNLRVETYVNTSKEVLAFMEAVTDFAQKVKFKKVSILESHQSMKKDVSGTARHLAKMLGRSSRVITSIRDGKEQVKLGIPKDYLDSHAYHKISFVHDGLVTDFTVLVLGRETYARGALDIVRKFK